MKVINNQHSKGMKMNIDSVVEVETEKWKVKSEDGKQSYDIIKQCESWTDASCLLGCLQCNICVHMFLCNCPNISTYFKLHFENARKQKRIVTSLTIH
jgi:hypothetical protein